MATQRGRTICFIDNSYIFRGSYKHQWRVDFRKLVDALARSGAIWQTFFFASEEDPPNADQTNLYKYLKLALHFEVRLHPLRKRQMRCNACGNEWSSYSEKAAAIAMASTLVSLAYNNAFDTAILVTGDSDFLEPIHVVKSLGKKIELAAWRDSIAQDLEMEASAAIFYLDENRSALERPSSGVVDMARSEFRASDEDVKRDEPDETDETDEPEDEDETDAQIEPESDEE